MSQAPGGGDDELSERAREIERRIQEGRYEIDLDTLAETLVDELDGNGDGDADEPGMAESDEAR